jgi:hypothetical protein
MRNCRIAAAFLFTLALAPIVAAQTAETYKVRLSPVAMDAAMRSVIAGDGMVTATLKGTKFTINGTFEGLKSNATVAHIHQGTAPGVRGTPLLNLTVTKDMSGDLSGSFDLTPEQIENLHKGRWYVQIHSEKAPAGNLWGWIVK